MSCNDNRDRKWLVGSKQRAKRKRYLDTIKETVFTQPHILFVHSRKEVLLEGYTGSDHILE